MSNWDNFFQQTESSVVNGELFSELHAANNVLGIFLEPDLMYFLSDKQNPWDINSIQERIEEDSKKDLASLDSAESLTTAGVFKIKDGDTNVDIRSDAKGYYEQNTPGAQVLNYIVIANAQKDFDAFGPNVTEHKHKKTLERLGIDGYDEKMFKYIERKVAQKEFFKEIQKQFVIEGHDVTLKGILLQKDTEWHALRRQKDQTFKFTKDGNETIEVATDENFSDSVHFVFAYKESDSAGGKKSESAGGKQSESENTSKTLRSQLIEYLHELTLKIHMVAFITSNTSATVESDTEG